MPTIVAWELSDRFSIARCVSEEEAVLHHRFAGDMHLVSGFAFSLLQLCTDNKRTIDELFEIIDSSFDIDPELELKVEIEKVMRQLYGLGIIAPCPVNVA